MFVVFLEKWNLYFNKVLILLRYLKDDVVIFIVDFIKYGGRGKDIIIVKSIRFFFIFILKVRELIIILVIDTCLVIKIRYRFFFFIRKVVNLI